MAALSAKIAPVRSHSSIRRGRARTAFLTAFAFSLCGSASVICERLAQGRSTLGWLCSLAVTFGAVVLVVSGDVLLPAETRRTGGAWTPLALLRAQVLGALAAIAAVHAAILTIPAARRLVERPAQFVNDAVLAVAILGLVWSYTSRAALVRALLPVVSFGLVAAYSATADRWHLDPFQGFGVQHYVVAQVLATGASLWLYYVVTPDRWGWR